MVNTAVNCRPVSLMNMHLFKTIEHIIESNINKHLVFESILVDCQQGIPKSGVLLNWSQLVQFYHNMVRNLDGARDRCHEQTGVIIMDFAEVFDKEPHRRL